MVWIGTAHSAAAALDAGSSATAGDAFDLMIHSDTAMAMIDKGSDITSASTYWMRPSKSTLLPVSSLQTGRNIDVPELMNSAQNMYDTVPATMLMIAAGLQGFFESITFGDLFVSLFLVSLICASISTISGLMHTIGAAGGYDVYSSFQMWKKKTDKLTFKIVSGDLVQFSGTVNGAKFSATSAPLRLIYSTLDRSADPGVVKEIDGGVEYTTYRLYADLVALKGKYFHPLVIEVMVNPAGDIELESWQ